jgi:hypothetical protein
LLKNDPTFNKADLTVQGIKIARPLVIRVTNGRMNFRNSWRRDDGQHLPIEVLYIPTDWKLFYTAEMASSVQKMHEAASRMAYVSFASWFYRGAFFLHCVGEIGDSTVL